MKQWVLLLGFSLLACDEKPSAVAPVDAPGAAITREVAVLQRLEAAHHAQKQQLAALGDKLPTARLVDGLSTEAAALERAHKTLATVQASNEPGAQARVEQVMAEVQALRTENEALWAALQVDLAKLEATTPAKPEPPKKPAE